MRREPSLSCLIAMPLDAPEITRSECVAAGSEIYLVDGLIGDAGAIIAAAVSQRPGCQDVSTLKEPYRLEGKKTIGLEIVEQLGWRVPDVIMCPVGGGVGLIGIYKALLELQQLGWIGAELPRLVAVQAAGCAPVVRAFERGGAADRAVGRCQDDCVRPHGTRAARRLPYPRGDRGHRWHGGRGDRRRAARQPAPGRAG